MIRGSEALAGRTGTDVSGIATCEDEKLALSFKMVAGREAGVGARGEAD